jgi:hypothetical protein
MKGVDTIARVRREFYVRRQLHRCEPILVQIMPSIVALAAA